MIELIKRGLPHSLAAVFNQHIAQACIKATVYNVRGSREGAPRTLNTIQNLMIDLKERRLPHSLAAVLNQHFAQASINASVYSMRGSVGAANKQKRPC